MGLVTALTATAISNGCGSLPPEAAPPQGQPQIVRLFSELFSKDRFEIRVTSPRYEVSPEFKAVIHSATLRSSEHLYYL